ncbi:50S ribosomal protein L5 [Candidatus Shapirobacteria bacterium]|nr:50S ribosomal protein L5 [Candidatus Shapirobacteria bacterium]
MAITKVQQSVTENLKKLLPKHNLNALPKLTKVVLNYRISEGRDSQENLNNALAEITAIAGQVPKLCKSKTSIANFKLREGEPLAYKVTLRDKRMYDFVEKLFNLVLPRLRDFKGMPLSSFDNEGNYNLVIRDQTYFPEINLDKVTKIRSVQVTLCISSSSKDESKMLLSTLGFPFEKI